MQFQLGKFCKHELIRITLAWLGLKFATICGWIGLDWVGLGRHLLASPAQRQLPTPPQRNGPMTPNNANERNELSLMLNISKINIDNGKQPFIWQCEVNHLYASDFWYINTFDNVIGISTQRQPNRKPGSSSNSTKYNCEMKISIAHCAIEHKIVKWWHCCCCCCCSYVQCCTALTDVVIDKRTIRLRNYLKEMIKVFRKTFLIIIVSFKCTFAHHHEYNAKMIWAWVRFITWVGWCETESVV